MRQPPLERFHGEYFISTDPARLDLSMIETFLSQSSYWAKNRSSNRVILSIENSLNFGLYHHERQIGFARVVTDYATFAWLADVFVIQDYRGQGLGKWLIETIIEHRVLMGLERWVLATRDAHGFYNQFGFVELRQPHCWMERTELS